ncbi:MAG: hypothetical protein AB7S97_05575 [Thermoplasmata archaeon]
MEFQGIDEFMRYLKGKYDESERRHEWRALTGRDHVASSYDTFIFTDQKVYQIKARELAPQVMAAVANEVGGPSPDMLEMVRGGSPVPLSVISRARDASAVVMFGMQQYSSDVADVFKREYYGSRQDALKAELDRRVETMIERPELKRAYRSLREREDGYFA